jgi:hypothetical protein
VATIGFLLWNNCKAARAHDFATRAGRKVGTAFRYGSYDERPLSMVIGKLAIHMSSLRWAASRSVSAWLMFSWICGF